MRSVVSETDTISGLRNREEPEEKTQEGITEDVILNEAGKEFNQGRRMLCVGGRFRSVWGKFCFV